MKIDTTGKFGGRGIVINIKDNELHHHRAHRRYAGLEQVFAHIYRIVEEIDKESTKGLYAVEAVAKMRGRGSTVNLDDLQRRGF